MLEHDIPVSLQKALISGEINSTVLGVFLWGIYSAVYFGTLYLYLTKRSSGSRLIVGAITLSYFAYSASAIMFWYYDQFAVVNNSETRETLFAVLIEFGPQWPIFVGDVINFILAGVADGLLIWRCFNVWDRSLRAISIPVFLLFCEIVIDLVALIFQCAQHLKESGSQSTLDNQLIAAQAFITSATTLAATALVAYRIYRISAQDIPMKTARRVKCIVEVLLQSAAVYSVAAMARAITPVLPATLSNLASWQAANVYTQTLFTFISGVAPTILVARVAMLDDKDAHSSNSMSIPESIHFRVRSTIPEVGSQLSENSDYVGIGRKGILKVSDDMSSSTERMNI